MIDISKDNFHIFSESEEIHRNKEEEEEET
jgi:hypothetical protein